MRKITLIVAALLVAAGASAQETWGIKVGLNSAKESTDNAETLIRTGIHAGLFFEREISPKVDLQPEIVYSQQGGKSGSGATMEEKLDYINVPLMFKIYVNRARSLSIDVGPQIGYLVSAKVVKSSSTINTYDKMNKVDGAVCVGLSYKINDMIHLNIRGNVGVTKIIDGKEHTNTVGQFGIAFKL